MGRVGRVGDIATRPTSPTNPSSPTRPTSPTDPTRPHGQAYFRLAMILGALTAMGPLAIDMYLPALPAIADDLNTSAASVQVSLAVYFIGIAVGQAFYGPLSDRWGRKPVLYFGLAVFVASSVGCALAEIGRASCRERV